MKHLAFVLLALLAAPGVCRAECVAGEVRCSQDTYAPTTPTFHVFCDTPVMSRAVIDYDVPAGTFNLSYDEAMSVALSVRDEFVVSGPSAGSPVSMRVRLRFSGVACGYGPSPGSTTHGTMSLRLLDPLPGENPASLPYNVPYSPACFVAFADSVDLAFTRPAGTPFGLEIHGDAASGYNFHDDASFTFLDLPPGSTISSCKGYLQEQPTPAGIRSWGSLKAVYR